MADQDKFEAIKNLGRNVAAQLQVAKDAGHLLYFVPDPVNFPSRRQIVCSVAADSSIWIDAPSDSKAIQIHLLPKDFYHYVDQAHWQISEEPASLGLPDGIDPRQFQLTLKGI